ncbi:divalent-cation tolerance protein CutA [Leptolyngbya sp. CCY15150]|uniref:divalent-cation tolerance protein CutA n=1 Tax=Leptolyngbya sp. CCY15150 TaxID=2767772 RepID=UPI00194E9456|nr:divalent-cation tolerance protein CutA [Leptolyngbya sp. CCY15150]
MPNSESQPLETPRLGVVLVTVSSQSEGEAIARSLVERNLAACVSLMPIQSIYRWQGALCKDAEWQLVIKTNLAQGEDLVQAIQALHSYDLPEIIALPIVAGSSAYLAWVAETVSTPPSS